MFRIHMMSLLLLILIVSCDPYEQTVKSACPAIGWFDSVYTTVKLKSPLIDYKLLIDGNEVTADCLNTSPCVAEQKIENDILHIRLSYKMDMIPNKMDLTLIEKDSEIVRLEAFDVQPAFPASGGVVGDNECDGPKEAKIDLEEI